MEVATPPVRVAPCRRLGRFYQQETQQCIALLADVSQPLMVSTGVFTGNQPNVAADLLATWKTFPSSNDQHEGDCRKRAHAGMRHHPQHFSPLLPFLLDGSR